MNDAAVRIYVLNIGFESKFLSFPGKESFFEMTSPAIPSSIKYIKTGVVFNLSYFLGYRLGWAAISQHPVKTTSEYVYS